MLNSWSVLFSAGSCQGLLRRAVSVGCRERDMLAIFDDGGGGGDDDDDDHHHHHHHHHQIVTSTVVF